MISIKKRIFALSVDNFSYVAFAYDELIGNSTCGITPFISYYIDVMDNNFLLATKIASEVDFTSLAPAGNYSDTFYNRYWDGSVFVGVAEYCV